MSSWAKLCGGGLLSAALLVLVSGAETVIGKDVPQAEAKAKDIDVVLCLDVSGSMQGLIQAAKNKLWDLVNELAKAKPAPNLRVALYSYGHDSYNPVKGWVRKELDLTTDLDALYQKLFALTINGGEEYVTRVCRDAIVEQKWSQAKDALKLIFVAGNEPANQDRVVSIKEVAERAVADGVIINPIYCGGSDDGDAATWRELAGLAKGRFANINHNQQIAIKTPVDQKLAELAAELNNTYVAYGKGGGKAKADNQKLQSENAKKAGVEVLAARVQTQNSSFYNCADWDLVDKLKNDPKFDITKLPESELSDNLKKLKPEERVKYVKDMADKRANLQKQIDTLTKERNEYIRVESKKQATSATKAFDQALRETLKIQAQTKGIHIPD